ncbi:hypothetical protein ACFW0H_16885 [Pseudomonas sp. CR3202]|uniref:hypothetical protein n=1 Tax=Pseudomonas sp. CR3202 TaxID=3351532 RepID=UPI003BF405C1
MSQTFSLSVTTQGPLYPPSEVVNERGDFIVVGRIPQVEGTLSWGSAIVSSATRPPPFNELGAYDVQRWIDPENLGELADMVLHTLPLPLPSNNYTMLFAPEQRPSAHYEHRPSFPLHAAPIPDIRAEDGRRPQSPITLGIWLQASGELKVYLADDGRSARFELECKHLIPYSLYTVMSLRQHDLRVDRPSRPGPLGVPNVFLTDAEGVGRYWAVLPNPFPDANLPDSNRIINVIVLYMSSQMSHGGAVGWYGLGADIHAQLKLKVDEFSDFLTRG